MGQEKTTILTVGSGLSVNESLETFTAHDIRVDNYTTQWVQLGDVGRYVRPGAANVVLRYAPGLRGAKAQFGAPPGQTQAGAVNGQVCTIIWKE